MLGICCGLREEEQRLGDVIVGRRLQMINLRAGEEEIRDRGDAITAGHRLVERFTVADTQQLAASNAAALVLGLVEARAFAHRHRPARA